MGDSAKSKSNSFAYDLQHCPACKHELDVATSAADDDRKPKEGDFSLCMYCGEILRFIENFKLKVADQEDLEDLIDDSIETYDQLLEYQRFFREQTNNKF